MIRTHLKIALLSLILVASSCQGLGGSRGDAPRLYRVILPVPNLDRAVSFYSEILDVEPIEVSPGRRYYRCGDVVLALYNPRADGDRWAAKPNQDHVYFAVSDLEAAFARAQAMQCVTEEIATRPWGERSFYVQDPFGTPLCFVDQDTLFLGE